MAIEVPVRKEIASFESRPVFGLTGRQLVCSGVAVPLAVGSYFLCTQYLNLSTDAAGTITIFFVLPIFAFGMFKKDGYTFEKYIKIVWEHRYTQQKTFFTTENALVLYMPEDEYKSDLSKIMLSYSDKATTAQAEANITYHLTEKEEQQGVLQALASCRATVKLHKAYCKQHKKDLRTLKRRDRQELAHLKNLNVGGMETNITYHLTRKEERQGFLQARANCRAVADAYRTACRLRLKGERSGVHGNINKEHRAQDEAQGAQTGAT